MNDTATAGGTSGASLIPSTTDAFTIAHLAVLAIFALAVIAAIVWGARLKRRRKTAEREVATHNVESHGTDGHGEAEAIVAPEPAPSPQPAPPAAIEEPAAPPAEVAPPPAASAPIIDERLADEPIPAAGPLEAAPATEAASAPIAAGSSPADASVSTLKGLGPKLATRLGELGITTVGQVAALSDDEALRLDAQLGPFAGRMTRDRWIEQARFLAAGDTAGFEAVFGRL